MHKMKSLKDLSKGRLNGSEVEEERKLLTFKLFNWLPPQKVYSCEIHQSRILWIDWINVETQ